MFWKGTYWQREGSTEIIPALSTLPTTIFFCSRFTVWSTHHSSDLCRCVYPYMADHALLVIGFTGDGHSLTSYLLQLLVSNYNSASAKPLAAWFWVKLCPWTCGICCSRWVGRGKAPGKLSQALHEVGPSRACRKGLTGSRSPPQVHPGMIGYWKSFTG